MLSLVLSGLLHGHSPAAAQGARQIVWNDLIAQERVGFDDPYAKLTDEQFYDVAMVAHYRELREWGKLEPGSASDRKEAELVAKLADQGIDIDWLLSQRERVAIARAEQAEIGAIDGERIKLSGYALPLARYQKRVTEFLLVPWVGACSHTPPPPPNQIVRVHLSQGTELRDRFAPVSIEGRIEHRPDTYELFLVDGRRDIRVTYNLEATSISDAIASESNALPQAAIPSSVVAEQQGLQRWQTQISLLFTNAMTDLKGQNFSRSLLASLAIAFLYGVLHTLGPGHGKVAIVSYFVGEGGSLRRGVWMGIRIAILHVFAAVVLAIATDVAVRQVGGTAAGNFRVARLLSYGAIAAIGAWMLWKAAIVTQIGKRERPASPDLLSDNLTQVVLASSENAAGPHRGWGCRCLDCFAPNSTGGWLSVAIGAVPCSGALVVLLYGLANDLLGASIAMVVAISLGMAVTLSSIGILPILGRQTFDRRLGKIRRRETIAARLQVVAAAAVFLLGSGLFVVTALAWA